jgi:hypothetical protein
MIQAIRRSTNEMPEPSSGGNLIELFPDKDTDFFRGNGATSLKRGSDVLDSFLFLFGAQSIGVADVNFEMAHLFRTNPVCHTLVNVGNVTQVGHTLLHLKFVAEYAPQSQDLKIPCGGRDLPQTAYHASCVAL